MKKMLLFTIPLLFVMALTGCGKIGDPVPPAIIKQQKMTEQPKLTAPVGQQNDCSDYCSDEGNMAGKNFEIKD